MSQQLQWIIDMVNSLPEDLIEDWDHKSALIQFDGGYSKDYAECLALLDVIRRNPDALKIVTYNEIEKGQ